MGRCVVCMCMCACMSFLCMWSQKPEEGIRSIGGGVICGFELFSVGVGKLNFVFVYWLVSATWI